MLTHLVNDILEEGLSGTLDVIILGCTHYPFVSDKIKEHLTYLRNMNTKYQSLIPDSIAFVDPAKSLAIDLYNDLKNSGQYYRYQEAIKYRGGKCVQ